MTVLRKNIIPFIDEKYGIVKSIFNFPAYSGLPRVYVKVALGSGYKNPGFSASGAGITEKAALFSAVGEYVERYSCLRPKLAQYKDSAKLKQVHPAVFNPATRLNLQDVKWVKGKSLFSEGEMEVLLPLDAVSLSTSSCGVKERWRTTSTGAACGGTEVQCCWKGIAEILERDSFQYYWRRQLSAKRIDISSNKELDSFFKQYIKSETINFSLYALEMDWDVPSVFGIAEFKDGSCVVAASVRDTWLEAAKKTLLELAQSIVAYATEIFSHEVNSPKKDFSKVLGFQDHSKLYLSAGMSRYLDFFGSLGSGFSLPVKERQQDDEVILEKFLNEIKKINKEAYVVSLTSPELNALDWRVTKTLIPGMLDIEPNYIPKLDSPRLKEIDQALLAGGKRETSELIGAQPSVPHPFP